MKKILALLIGLACYFGAYTQPKVVDNVRFAFEPQLTVNSEIIAPEAFLGYELGASFTLYAQVENYLKSLAKSSPRVLYHEYGRTYEGRPLINLIISSEENIQNIDQIL